MRVNWLKLAVQTALGIFLIGCSNSGARRAGDEQRNAGKGGSSAPASAANSKGRELYAKNCSLCHQPDGEGGTVKIEDQKLKAPSLKSERVIKRSNESMTDQILKGGDGMPAFKERLKPEEINDLVRFIREELQGEARKDLKVRTDL